MTSRILPALASLFLSGAVVVTVAAIALWPSAAGDDKAAPVPGAPSAARRAASLADIAGGLDGGRPLAQRQPDRRQRLAGRPQERAGARRAQDRRQARRSGPLAPRPSRSGHPLVRLRHGDPRHQGRQARDRRPGRGRPRAPRRRHLRPTARRAYVAIGVENKVVRVDLNIRKITGTLDVGREPRGVALSLDDSVLLVGNARSQDVSVIDVETGRSPRRSRLTATTCARWRSAPTAKPATSPT